MRLNRTMTWDGGYEATITVQSKLSYKFVLMEGRAKTILYLPQRMTHQSGIIVTIKRIAAINKKEGKFILAAKYMAVAVRLASLT